MHLHARNATLEKDDVDQKAILQARKQRQSGKRRVIIGKYLMTGAAQKGTK